MNNSLLSHVRIRHFARVSVNELVNQIIFITRPVSVMSKCSFISSCCFQVSWLFNGEPVASTDFQIYSKDETYWLHIPEVFDEDAGTFSVVAENEHGRRVCSAMLNIVDTFDEPHSVSRVVSGVPPAPPIPKGRRLGTTCFSQASNR